MLVFFPFKYLNLRTERGWRIVIRDLPATVALAMVLLAPFGLIAEANLFHKDGYVEKIGAFSSVLTGFYVAGLLAVATFSTALGDLDKTIEHGAIILLSNNEDLADHRLTRREYVCQMFGYLATLSLAISLLSILAVVVAQAVGGPPHIAFGYTWYFKPIRLIVGGLFDILVSHLVVTTSIGLYYFVDRLYTKEPRIKPKPKAPSETE
jgi:hypothetical protein